MAKFTVRVELHGISHDSEEYDKLHREMEARNFKRYVVFDKVKYKLPPAEYRLDAEMTVAAVRDLAEEAASQVTNSFSVVGTEGNIATYNLEKIK